MANVLILNMATPESSKDAVPNPVVPSRNRTWPVGTPPVEAIVAVSITVEFGAAVAGAVRANVVVNPRTCNSILELLGRKFASPLYRTVMA